MSLDWYFSEIFWKFWSVVLEKLDLSCEEWRSVTRAKEERNIMCTVKERKVH